MLIFPLFTPVFSIPGAEWSTDFGPCLILSAEGLLAKSHLPNSGPLTICPDETSTLERTRKGRRAHHLGHAEAVLEVVEGNVVVAPVDLEQEVLQHLGLDVEAGREIQVGVHDLQEHHDLRILPLPAQNTHVCMYCVGIKVLGRSCNF